MTPTRQVVLTMTNKEVDKVMDGVSGSFVKDKSSVYDVVYRLFEKQVSEQAPKKLGKVAPDTPFDDMGVDSLEKLSVAMDLEEHFDLFIPDEDIEGFLTIQDVVDYLEVALVEKAAKAQQSEDSESPTLESAPESTNSEQG